MPFGVDPFLENPIISAAVVKRFRAKLGQIQGLYRPQDAISIGRKLSIFWP